MRAHALTSHSPTQATSSDSWLAQGKGGFFCTRGGRCDVTRLGRVSGAALQTPHPPLGRSERGENLRSVWLGITITRPGKPPDSQAQEPDLFSKTELASCDPLVNEMKARGHASHWQDGRETPPAY